MTDQKKTRQRRLSHEILGIIGLSALFALVLFGIVSGVALAVAETYCFENDIPMTEFDWIDLDRWIFGLSTLISVATFSVLFLCLLHDRIAYIRTITDGIDALGTGQADRKLPTVGNNELTALARAVNDMSEARQQLRQKEQALAREKDQLIRAISHDIRTPLTSILSYSEYLSSQEQVSDEDYQSYTKLIQKKAEQIRDLTDILLDGSKRNLEEFDNIALLMAQIAEEFQSELEDRFDIQLDLSGCAARSGTFDVQELRRIFDNLGSNIQKYADPGYPVRLSIRTEESKLLIRQDNTTLPLSPKSDSYGIGLTSIRRIAQHYAGQVTVQQSPEAFSITITLCDF